MTDDAYGPDDWTLSCDQCGKRLMTWDKEKGRLWLGTSAELTTMTALCKCGQRVPFTLPWGEQP